MYNLRKKTSPFKYKNESMRFVGDGQCFKAKLIGILEVNEARGDRMCQEALADLKMAIRAAGEHKQRITIHIALDGLRLRDEKNGDCLYHHPVHKISFIAQDMTDSRAFGYIFGSPDSGHRFFGIKTDKAASQVVIAMRDLFQVVFALKKKEIELAKLHLESNYKHHTSALPSDSSSNTELTHFTHLMNQALKNYRDEESKKEVPKKETKDEEIEDKAQSETVVANLVDLQLELNNLQQGINQMKKITPSDPFGSKEDPFGDSFTGFPNPILPPPPSSGKERSTRISDSGSLLSPRNPLTSFASDTASCDSVFGSLEKADGDVYKDGKKDISNEEWYSSFNTVFSNPKPPEDDKYEDAKKKILQQFDIFTELDPLGTGKIKPYVDKKYFFQELKERPKKALNDLVTENKSASSTDIKLADSLKSDNKRTSLSASADPFGEDPFDSLDPFVDPNFQKDPFEDEFLDYRKSKSSIGSENAMHSMSSPLPKAETERLDSLSGSFTNRTESMFNKPLEEKFLTSFQIAPPPLPPKKQNADTFQVKFPDISQTINSEIYSIPKSEEYYLDFKSEADKRTPSLFKSSKDNLNDKFSKCSLETKNYESLNTWETTLNNKDKEEMSDVLDELDINLSELRLADLNKLANSLNIPSYLLGKMSIVELTEYLANVIKSRKIEKLSAKSTSKNEFEFEADFEKGLSEQNSVDRYAVLRELIEQENKQMSAPVEITEEPKTLEISKNSSENLNQSITSSTESHDKYAALRDIVEHELKESSINQYQDKDSDEFLSSKDDIPEVVESSIQNENEGKKTVPDSEILLPPIKDQDEQGDSILLSKQKMENSMSNGLAHTKIGSESASDIASESSPENDNVPYNEEKDAIVTEEKSWTAFEQINDQQESNNKKDTTQSEDAHSPWSSDSKEYINQSPSEWKKGDSESDQWVSLPPNRRYRDNWWIPPNEREMYHMPSRHAYTYGNEYENYNRQRRRRRDQNWTKHNDEYETGEHSSSSRETSPWEEKPKREPSRDSRLDWPRKNFDRMRDKRFRDEWFEDEYEYQENFKPPHRNGSYRNREHETELRRQWTEDMPDRSFRKKRENLSERWYSSDWKDDDPDKSPVRYSTMPWRGPAHSQKWQEREYNDVYFSRSLHDSWEEDYSGNVENIHMTHSATFGRKWKRPSSASEMERKGDMNPRHYFNTGNSDGERDKRYRPPRRSKSRDSRYSEPKNMVKFDPFSLSSSTQKSSSGRYKTEKQLNNPTTWAKPEGFEQEFSKAPSVLIQKKKECCKVVERKDYGSMKRNRGQGKSLDRSPSQDVHEKSKPDLAKPKLPLYESLKTEQTESNNKSEKLREFHYPKNSSLFEDDFSPEKSTEISESKAMSTVKEEADLSEAKDSFEMDDTRQKFNMRKQSFYKSKGSKLELKKSESVNIFGRENDPFDDDFFAEDEFFDNSK